MIPAVGPIQPGEAAQQSGLARPGGAEEDGEGKPIRGQAQGGPDGRPPGEVTRDVHVQHVTHGVPARGCTAWVTASATNEKASSARAVRPAVA